MDFKEFVVSLYDSAWFCVVLLRLFRISKTFSLISMGLDIWFLWDCLWDSFWFCATPYDFYWVLYMCCIGFSWFIHTILYEPVWVCLISRDVCDVYRICFEFYMILNYFYTILDDFYRILYDPVWFFMIYTIFYIYTIPCVILYDLYTIL